VRGRNLLWALGFGLLIIPLLSPGQSIPPLINYQGRLTDAAGLPITNASVPMVFGIWDAATVGSGAQLWTEAQAVPVTNGLYSVRPGAVTPIPASVFSASPRYLEVSVFGQTLSPRAVLTAVPWALNADRLDNYEASAFALSAHNHSGANITSGTIGTAFYSAYSDLADEGYLDNNTSLDLLTQGQGDGRYVNEGQTDSITAGMAQFNYAGSSSEGGIATNSDQLDGLHASAFVTRDGDTMTGPLSAPELWVNSLSGGATVGVFPASYIGFSAYPLYSAGQRTQHLYLAAELPHGLITAVELEVASGATVTFNGLQLTMGTTNLTALTSTYASNYATSTVVRQAANLTVPSRASTQFVSIPLDQPYYWSGTSNLIVEYNVPPGAVNLNARINSAATARNLYGAYNATTGTPTNYLHRHRLTVSAGVRAQMLNATVIYFGDLAKTPLNQTTWDDLSDGGVTSLHSHDLASLTGTLGTGSYSAYGDLTAEGYLDNSAAGDLLTQTQADSRFINTTGDDSMSGTLTVGGDLIVDGNNIGIGMVPTGAIAIANNRATAPTLGADLYGTNIAVQASLSTDPGDHYALLATPSKGVEASCGNTTDETLTRTGGSFVGKSQGAAYGVEAKAYGNGSSSAMGISVLSRQKGTGGALGGYFSSEGGPGPAVGLDATSNGTSSGDVIGVRGYADNTSTGDVYAGIFNTSHVGSGYHYGVYATAISPADFNFGVYGRAEGGANNWGLYISMGSKSWVNPDPEDPEQSIAYATLEGGENGTYWRGTARLNNGSAQVILPDHFRKVTSPDGPVTVTVSPLGECNGLMVAAKSNESITVKELMQGKSNVEFDFIVMGKRRGYEDYNPIIPNLDYVPFQNNLRTMDESETTQEFYDRQSNGMKRIFQQNGTLTNDGKVNETTFKNKGWKIVKEKNPKPSPQP
jgi:hypothetical protein